MKVNLEFPVRKPGILNLGDTIVTEIIIKRPTVADMKGLRWDPPHNEESFKVLMVRVTGLDMPTIERLDLKDYSALAEAFHKLSGIPR